MKALFDIHSTALQWAGYSISYVELIGTLFGLISVFLATKTNILTWPTGIVNEIFLFLLFFQVQLYADMFLQVYFLIVTVYGWYCWGRSGKALSISKLTLKAKIYVVIIGVSATVVVGFCVKNIHNFLPQYFTVPAAYPIPDSFVMVVSILATVLLARKKIENWYLWIAVNVFSVALFAWKGVYFLSLEYVIFLGLATVGLMRWRKQLSNG